jgi:phosphoglucosamine mutase
MPPYFDPSHAGESFPAIARRLAADIDAVEAELGATGRVLVRASGTEPLVRVMVEAPTDDEAHRIADQIAAAIRAADAGR